MTKYSIIRKRTKDGTWEVWWDKVVVFSASNPEMGEFLSACFADGLERGITGSKMSLGANSRIKIKGWMEYLSAFPTYEDYAG